MSSARARLVLGFAIANLALVIIVSSVWLNKPKTPPLIQGVLLQEGRALEEFRLIDHHNQRFDNRALLGRSGGLFFRHGHRAGLARQTDSILNDDTLAGSMSASARQRVTACFSINRMVECHAQLYRELAA